MKKLIILAAIAAALVIAPAYATTYNFYWNSTGVSSSNAGPLDVGSWSNIYTATGPLGNASITVKNYNTSGTQGSDLAESYASRSIGGYTTSDWLGQWGGSYRGYIDGSDYIMLDFSSLEANYTINSAYLTIYDNMGSWSLYGSNTAGGNITSWGTALASGSSSTRQNITSFLSSDAYLALDCNKIQLGQLTLDLSAKTTPEPATFMLMGGALVTIALVRRRKRPSAK